MKLSNNTILITGGTSGIGLELASTLVNLGNTVITCSRNQDHLALAKQKCPDLIIFQCDISNQEQRQNMVKQIIKSGYKINVLINNAAKLSINDFSKSNNTVIENIKKEIAINLISPMELIDELLPIIKKQSHATIINMNSPAAVVPIAKIAAYSTAKAGLLSYSRSLRYHLKKDNVKVIDVFPPGVKTAMTDMLNTGRPLISTKQFTHKLIRELKLGKNEIWIGDSKIIRFLAHFSSRWLFNWANNQLPTDI